MTALSFDLDSGICLITSKILCSDAPLFQSHYLFIIITKQKGWLRIIVIKYEELRRHRVIETNANENLQKLIHRLPDLALKIWEGWLLCQSFLQLKEGPDSCHVNKLVYSLTLSMNTFFWNKKQWRTLNTMKRKGNL